MKKTMYAIVDKTSREILGFDWEEGRPLLGNTLEAMETTLFTFKKEKGSSWSFQQPHFNNAEVVQVTLEWS